jgi:hypothetical protein
MVARFSFEIAGRFLDPEKKERVKTNPLLDYFASYVLGSLNHDDMSILNVEATDRLLDAASL